MKKTVNRLLAMILSVVMLMCPTLTSAFAEAAEEPEELSIEAKTYPYVRQYSDDTDIIESEITFYYINGIDIPYVAISEFMPLLSELLEDMDYGEITYEVKAIGDHFFSVSREDVPSTMYIDTEEDDIMFMGFNSFTQKVGQRALVTVMGLPEGDDIDPELFAELMIALTAADEEEELDEEDLGLDFDFDFDPDEDEEQTPESDEKSEPSLFSTGFRYLNREGVSVDLNLNDYLIDLYTKDGECYIPFQTMNDLLIIPTYMQYVFTGEKLIGSSYGGSLLQTMYEAPAREMSEDFALFNYNELRLMLDCWYGLKPEHNITDFGTFLAENTALVFDLTSTDARTVDFAVNRLTGMYFDDLHSGFSASSFMSGESTEKDMYMRMLDMGPSTMAIIKEMQKYGDARKAVYGDVVPQYEEIGDTAFITFDKFTALKEDADYLDPDLNLDDPQDTIELIMYANQQIKRENSPIKNIVLDLSNNGGGSAYAAVFVISWFLGEADIALRDTMTGAETNMIYYADVDRDGAFVEEDDSLTGYNLYCLTSPNSFSCGNLLPAAFKSSHRVTLVGQPSGGGSCVVQPCTTASGTIFQISGCRQLAIIRNGSFYNIDQGIEPDVVLVKPESFYDRPALVDYLNNLK